MRAVTTTTAVDWLCARHRCRSAEILASASGKGESSRSRYGPHRSGRRRRWGGWGGVDMRSSNFGATILGEATNKAVADLAQQLDAKAGALPTTVVQISGLVADAEPDAPSLSMSAQKPASKSADRLDIRRKVREVKDPGHRQGDPPASRIWSARWSSPKWTRRPPSASSRAPPRQSGRHRLHCEVRTRDRPNVFRFPGYAPFGIAPQHAQKVRQFPQVVQPFCALGVSARPGNRDRRGIPTVFPQRARFDLIRFRSRRRKSASARNSDPGTLRVLNTSEGLPRRAPVNLDGVPARVFGRSKQEKPGEFRRFVFDRSAGECARHKSPRPPRKRSPRRP